MSPKQMTRSGFIIGTLSMLGIIPMLLFDPDMGILKWWPAMGIGIALLLFVAAYTKGAYLVAQRRAEMVDMLNDCYNGVESRKEG